MKNGESELSKTFKYSLVQDKLCGLTASPKGARGLRKSPATKGLAVKANPHQLEPRGGWSPAIDAQTQRRHCKGNMGDENGSGGNKIGTASHTGDNKPVKIRNCFFTRQIFKEDRHVLWLSKCHLGCKGTPCYHSLRNVGRQEGRLLKVKRKQKEASLPSKNHFSCCCLQWGQKK